MQGIHSITSIATDDTWRDHYATPQGCRWWPSEELVRSLGEQRFDTIVEAGCGNGANVWLLAEHADRVIGVDTCEDALAIARSYAERRGVAHDDRVTLRHGDVRDLLIEDASVDAVVDVYTSQHLSWADHAVAYREYHRVLRPGGWLFLQHLSDGTTTTGAHWIEPYTVDDLPTLFPGVGPVSLPSEPALLAQLDRASLTPTSSRGLLRRYADGRIAQYLIVEARAV